MSNLVIGITGGIGSGKTTVCKLFEKRGFQVLRADNIAKKIMREDPSVKHNVISEFGEECFINNELNTKFLANQVFNHPQKINKLNSIVHPLTIKQIQIEIGKLKKENKLLFVESALIFEAKMVDMFDYILLVTAQEDTRIRRVLKRDRETISEIRSRILNQIPEEQKRGKSDFIIDNDSSIQDLETKSVFFLKLFENLTN